MEPRKTAREYSWLSEIMVAAGKDDWRVRREVLCVWRWAEEVWAGRMARSEDRDRRAGRAVVASAVSDRSHIDTSLLQH